METERAQALFSQVLYRRYGDRNNPKHYVSDLGIFCRQLGETPIREVSAQDIDRFMDRQHEEQLAPTTINRRLATLHTFFECMAAQEPDGVWPNPVTWRRHRLKEGQPLPRDASDREVEQLFAVIGGARDAALCGLMVGAGLRVEEVVTLHMSQHYTRLYDSTVKKQFASTAAALEGIPVSDWLAYATTPFVTQHPATDSDSV